jgi:hypothetical protein
MGESRCFERLWFRVVCRSSLVLVVVLLLLAGVAVLLRLLGLLCCAGVAGLLCCCLLLGWLLPSLARLQVPGAGILVVSVSGAGRLGEKTSYVGCHRPPLNEPSVKASKVAESRDAQGRRRTQQHGVYYGMDV